MKPTKALYSHFYRDINQKGSTSYMSKFEEDVDRFKNAVQHKYGHRKISIKKELVDGFWSLIVTLKKEETVTL